MYLEKIEKDGVILEIHTDECCPNPREYNDNLGTMVCWHNRYNLGDKHNYDSPKDFWTALAEEITGDTDKVERMSLQQRERIARENAIVLPLYMYEHGGRAMRTYPFNDPWDSGQVGWIYVLKKKVREEYSVNRVTKDVRDSVISVLKAEVEEYIQWAEGDVYGYILEDAEGNEIDSCWGFFGTDWKENCMADQIPAEYRCLLEEVA